MAENEVIVAPKQDNEVVLAKQDFCAAMTVQKAQGQQNARCTMCFQREGNPGDCVGGDRFNVSFGACGGVVLCVTALRSLATKIRDADV